MFCPLSVQYILLMCMLWDLVCVTEISILGYILFYSYTLTFRDLSLFLSPFDDAMLSTSLQCPCLMLCTHPAVPLTEDEWVPLELCFGMPLFSSELNRKICRKIASHGLCSKDRYWKNNIKCLFFMSWLGNGKRLEFIFCYFLFFFNLKKCQLKIRMKVSFFVVSAFKTYFIPAGNYH